jgi:hypothetical protein
MDAESYGSPHRTCDGCGVISEQLLVRSHAVVSRCVAGETLIVPVRGKVGDLASIYSFNETGSLIWELLATPTTLFEVVSTITREFDVTREQAESDALRFVREMLLVGLVEVSKAVGGTEGPVGREGLAAANVS